MRKRSVFYILFVFVLTFNIFSEEDYEARKKELENRKKSTEIQLNSAKKKENELLSRINRLKEEMTQLQEEIDFVSARVTELSEKLKEQVDEKERLSEQLDTKLPLLSQYLVYLYKRKNWDYSRIFFDSSSFNQFLRKYRIMKRLIKEELIFIDSLRTDIKRHDDLILDIKENTAELNDFYDQLESQQIALNEKENEKKRLLDKVREEKEALEEKYRRIEQDYSEISSLIEKKLQRIPDADEEKEKTVEESEKQEPSKQYSFSWPVSRKGLILLPFGKQYNEFNTLFFNQGIDIQVSRNDWVIASESGKVAYKGRMSGLGKILIIKHGNVYTTVYTYLDDIFVRIGQEVKKGEKLATILIDADKNDISVLHFEIRKKGEPLNPENLIVMGEDDE